MSKYTTEVRFICETYAGLTESKGYGNIGEIIESARPKIFDFDFPIYDESYRSVIETKILKRYYTKEIGFETVGLWKHFLDMRLNEIMPYYNQLYKSATLEFNPFYDVDLTTDSNRNINHDEKTTDDNTRTDNLSHDTTSKNTRTDNLNETTNGTSTRTDDLKHSDTTNTNNTRYDEYSDTPQGTLTNVRELNYLTNARQIIDSGSEQNNGTNTGTETTVSNGTRANTGTQQNDITSNLKDTGTQENKGNGTRVYDNTDAYLEHVKGKRGGASYASLLNEYRSTFINIDRRILDELGDLFMNVW